MGIIEPTWIYTLQPGSKSTDSTSATSKPVSDSDMQMFKDPEDYQSMSVEDREEETNKMKGKYRSWAGQSFMQGKGKTRK